MMQTSPFFIIPRGEGQYGVVCMILNSKKKEQAMVEKYYARTSDHGYETCAEHLSMTGALSGAFANRFDHLETGLVAGLLHDQGKYSDAFQKRIRDPEHTSKVDHSSSGAVYAWNLGHSIEALAIASHHSGLANLGVLGENEGSSWFSRLARVKNDIENIILNQERMINQFGEEQLPQSQQFPPTTYSRMMLTRMILSTLVDADRLDAEYFTTGSANRRERIILDSVKQRLDGNALSSQIAPSMSKLIGTAQSISAELLDANLEKIFELSDLIEHHDQQFFDNPNKTLLNVARCDILRQCLENGSDPAFRRGIYSLTAPTGSGKTNASISFAIEHAKTNHLERVIYVIPYMSIIDQTAQSFGKIFGEDDVLPHYSEADYQIRDESDLTECDLRKRLAAENWNAPIVVTTAVQFFESLYSNKTSRARKLHNIANSVIVFDEAQTLPVPFLLPCVQAIAELVEHYHCSAVLCTATQPALDDRFRTAFNDATLIIPEVVNIAPSQTELFKRTTIEFMGSVEIDALADELAQHDEVLCVVNTRKKAQQLYDLLIERSQDEDGVFCLTTLQCAADRTNIIDVIRRRLREGETCRVVSTSLIEAGVDVDFPAAYREKSGLDSILQTAGRCNREGKRPIDQSIVKVFDNSEKPMPLIAQNVGAMESVRDRFKDVSSQNAIHEYFRLLFSIQGDDVLDSKGIVSRSNRMNMPFADISKDFTVIDSPTTPVYVRMNEESEELCNRLLNGEYGKNLFRKLGRYSVNVWPQHLQAMLDAGMLDSVGDGSDDDAGYILRNAMDYSPNKGLVAEVNNQASDFNRWNY